MYYISMYTCIDLAYIYIGYRTWLHFEDILESIEVGNYIIIYVIPRVKVRNIIINS